MTTSPHVCLGCSCSASSITSPQGMHLSVSPRRGAPNPWSDTAPHPHEEKPLAGPRDRERFVPCRHSRRAPAPCRAGSQPRSCAFPGASSSSSSGEPAGTEPSSQGELRQPPPHQRFPDSSPEPGHSVTTPHTWSVLVR